VKLLKETVFRRYWTASTISLLGDQISAIAVPLAAVLTLHAGPVQMGYLTALEWLPSLLFGLHLGAWVDRLGRRRQVMIAADLGRAALWLSVPLCYVLHVLTLPQLYILMFASGTLSILFMVANSALFVAIVPQSQYVDGQTLMNGSRGLTAVAGPAFGGMLIDLLSAPVAIVTDALSFIGSAFFLGRIRPDEPAAAEPGKGSMTEGARFIGRNAIVRASLIAIAPVNFFAFMFNAIYLLYAVRDLHIRPYLLGLVLGAAAVGSILGAVLTDRIATRIGIGRAYMLGCLISALSLLLWPAAQGPEPLVVAMVFVSEFGAGFGLLMLDISAGSIFAAVIPDTLRSRVTGAFQAVNYGTRPAGALLGGLLGTAIGLRPTLLVGAAGSLLGFLLLLPSSLSRYRMPQSEPAPSEPAPSEPAPSEPAPSETVRTVDSM
jgi:MFS family permease